MKYAVAAALLVVGCKGGASGREDSGAGSGAGRTQTQTRDASIDAAPVAATVDGPPLVITVGDHQVKAASAIAYRNWMGRLVVRVSTLPLTCDDLHSRPGLGEGFEASLKLLLHPDGSITATLRDVDWDDLKEDSVRAVPILGDGTPGATTTLKLDFHGEHSSAAGVVTATNCEDPPDPGAPPLQKPMPASITVAGRTLPVRFASLERDPTFGTTVKLHTGTAGCAYEVPGGMADDFVVELHSWPEGKADVMMFGELMPDRAEGMPFTPDQLAFSPYPVVAGPSTIKGDFTFAGYAVRLAGKVVVTECPR